MTSQKFRFLFGLTTSVIILVVFYCTVNWNYGYSISKAIYKQIFYKSGIQNQAFLPSWKEEISKWENSDLLSRRHSLKRVTLFIAIISAPVRVHRRIAVRETWLSTLSNYPGFAMRFFTDELGLTQDMETKLKQERERYRDLEFMPLKSGLFLTHRFLWAMFWAYENYNFEFFLKTDDDYFICLNHLTFDIKKRAQDQKGLYWGWLHCERDSHTWIDEGFVIISRSLADEIVKRNRSLMCHQHGDQALAFWVLELEKQGVEIRWFGDNDRLIQDIQDFPKKMNKQHLCSKLLGVHQAYRSEMYKYWSLTKGSWFHLADFKIADIKPFNRYCPYKKGLHWTSFPVGWRFEPKPCWAANMTWSTNSKNEFFIGREGTTT